MTTKPQSTYAVGDRVAERPKAHGLAAVREETKQRIAQYRSQRYGTVIRLTRKDKRTKNVIDERITPELIREAIALRDKGFSPKQLAFHFKLKSDKTIIKWIKRVEEEGEFKAFAKTRIVSEPYLVIQWDHLKSPSEHAQGRICHEHELFKLQASGYGTGVE